MMRSESIKKAYENLDKAQKEFDAAVEDSGLLNFMMEAGWKTESDLSLLLANGSLPNNLGRLG